MRYPSKEQLQEEARLLLAEFEGLPPMPLSAGYPWLQVYVSLYLLGHDQQPPAAHLLIISKAIRLAHEQYWDAVLERLMAVVRMATLIGGVIGGLTFALDRLSMAG